MNFRLMALNIKEFVPDLSLPVIKQRINVRYKQILNSEKWEFLKDSTTVRLRGIETSSSTMTVAVVPGGVTVTGTGTTWYGTATSGWLFRVNDESQPYEVSSVTNDTQILLMTAYGGTTVTAGDFEYFKNRYTPDVGDCGEINSIVYQSQLEETTEAWINANDPERTSTGQPAKWVNHSKSSSVDGLVTFEIWPIPDQDYVVTVNYTKTVTDLSNDSDTPLFRPEVLEAGALWDCYRIAFRITNNTAYIGLARDAKTDFETELRKMTLEDLRTASLPRRVRDVMGVLDSGGWDDNFRVSHDVD